MSRAAELQPSVSVLPTPSGYVQRSTLPLHSLLFLLPLVLIYELGTRYFTTAAQSGQDQEIIAFSRMLQFFRWWGATGRHMPGFTVVSLLLLWHLLRRDAWGISLNTLLGMTAESIALGLPLLLLAYAVNRYFPLVGLRATGTGPMYSSKGDQLIMDIGAGVYEEFMFRFAFFTFGSLLIHDLMRIPQKTGYVLMVVLSGFLFSLYHYWSPTEHFLFRIFAFRTVAGMYFGLIFMFRGIGITSGSHCAYDLIITLF